MQLPEKVSIPYFIKVLDMQKQYREVIKKWKNKTKIKNLSFNLFPYPVKFN